MTNRYFKFTTSKLKKIFVWWTFHLPKPPSMIILKEIINYTLISRRTGSCCIPCVFIIVSKGELQKCGGQHREDNVPLHPLVDGDFICSASSMRNISSSRKNFFQPYFVIGWGQESASCGNPQTPKVPDWQGFCAKSGYFWMILISSRDSVKCRRVETFWNYLFPFFFYIFRKPQFPVLLGSLPVSGIFLFRICLLRRRRTTSS